MNSIISQNTEWSSGSTHAINGEIQIAAGATLTIDPGTVVSGGTIEVFGSLIVGGSASDNVDFNNVDVSMIGASTDPAQISINEATISGGTFLAPTGNATYGSFSLVDSTFKDVDSYAYVWYPTSYVTITGNLFDGFGGFSVGSSGPDVTITHNTFINSGSASGADVSDWAAYNNAQILVKYNNFLDVGHVALSLPDGYTNAAMIAPDNYFGTTDPATISQMVFDKSSDLNSAGVIPISPTLSAPDPTAPQPPSQPSTPGVDAPQPQSSPSNAPTGASDGTVPVPVVQATFTGEDMTTGQLIASYGASFSDVTANNLFVSTSASNPFIVTGAGDDILQSSGTGTSVLDDTGGALNFEIGSTVGRNAFFLSALNNPISWNTIANFQPGDFAVIYGIDPQSLSYSSDDLGAPSYKGLTLETFQNGGAAFVTFAGHAKADLGNSLATAFGTDPSGRSFLLVVGS